MISGFFAPPTPFRCTIVAFFRSVGRIRHSRCSRHILPVLSACGRIKGDAQFELIDYDGTDFQGWQKQPGYRTVQETLETALADLTGESRIRVNGSGRTDKGVHTVAQVAT